MSTYRNPLIADEYEGATAAEILKLAEVQPTVRGEFRIRADHPTGAFDGADVYLNTYGAAELGELSLVIAPAGRPSIMLRVTPADVERWEQLRQERAASYARDAGLL